MVFVLLLIILFVKNGGLYFVFLCKVRNLAMINHTGDSTANVLAAGPPTFSHLEAASRN